MFIFSYFKDLTGQYGGHSMVPGMYCSKLEEDSPWGGFFTHSII